MTIETSTQGDITIFSLSGDMDLFSAKDLKLELSKVFATGHCKLIIHMAEVSYLDSMGIGCLLYAFAESKKTHVSLLISEVQGSPRKVIQLTKLDQYFPLMDSLEEAVEKLSE